MRLNARVKNMKQYLCNKCGKVIEIDKRWAGSIGGPTGNEYATKNTIVYNFDLCTSCGKQFIADCKITPEKDK